MLKEQQLTGYSLRTSGNSREGTITRMAYSCMLIVGINAGWTGPFLPQIARATHLPVERVGLIVSAGSAGYFISVLIAGEIHQRLSARKVLVGAMVLYTAGVAALAGASTLAGLLCAGVLIGLANGGVDIGANAIVVELNRERLASALNYLHVLFGVGALAGPLIVSAGIASGVSYWWIFGGGAFACAAIAFRIGATSAIEVETDAGPGGGFLAMLARPVIWAISTE
ncbi:MAG TPA: MFS transporter, partial [Candidatus Binatus sp.]|nr:MFS transporter [Candidatus Binatus sp.]